MAGVYNFLPLGLRVLSRIQNVVREEMNRLGAQEILMPALTQFENYQTTGRHTLEILFQTLGPREAKYFLNQSHEEVVTPLAQSHIFSYHDLPLAVYQIQTKFRNEPRAKSGLLRGREFSMKDLYSFHTSETDLNEYYEKVKAAYFKIYERLGFKDRAVLTFASGGTFSKYSHEFQILADVGEDTVFLCEKCRVAVNKELIAEQKTCPECGNAELIEKRGIEVGNIFKLRTRFSKAFNFTYIDQSGQKNPVEMGCYGIGNSRLMGAIVEVSHDEKGIIWPEAVAPYKIHLLHLGKEKEAKDAVEDVYEKLQHGGAEVLYDDREESAGKKLADADLVGIPIRLLISKKTLEKKSAEVKLRSEKDFKLIPLDVIPDSILASAGSDL